LRRYLPILWVISMVSLVGCATTDDLRRTRGDLGHQILATNEKIDAVERGMAPLKEEIAGLRGEIEKTNRAIDALRGSQADARVEISELKEQLEKNRGIAEGFREEIRQEIAAASAKATKREEEEKGLREKLDGLIFKINFIENFLEISKKEEATPPAVEKGEKPPPAPAAKEATAKGKMDKESLYAAAYELFKQGKYDKAREGFENFLKLYPDTELSDNAQFWIGECYYFGKNYEKAIIEYDKVSKQFPEGNKVPYALLKQGLSFLKLGDTTSAKLLLQQVVKDFPNTSQARIARTKLLEIK
jgi:tol-pal system protein YbgF